MGSQNRLLFLMELESCLLIERNYLYSIRSYREKWSKEVNSGNNRTERMVTDCLPQAAFETVRETRLHSSHGGICGILFLNRFYNIKQIFLLLLSFCWRFWPQSLRFFFFFLLSSKISWNMITFRNKRREIRFITFWGLTKFSFNTRKKPRVLQN